MKRVQGMEALRQDDLERARQTPPEEKAKQAFALMRFGIKLQRSKLQREFPDEPEEQIRQRLLLHQGRRSGAHRRDRCRRGAQLAPKRSRRRLNRL
jgi:hypothetical protein